MGQDGSRAVHGFGLASNFYFNKPPSELKTHELAMLVGIVKGLAADLVGTGATACAVSPGSTETDMLRQTAALYGVTTDDLVQHQLIRRAIAPSEVAAAIAFCASPAGGVVNGTVLHADGGFGGFGA